MRYKKYTPAIMIGADQVSFEADMQESDTGEYVKVRDYLELDKELACKNMDYEHLHKIKEHYFDEVCKLKDQLRHRSDRERLLDVISSKVLPASADPSDVLVKLIQEQSSAIKSLSEQVSLLTSQILGQHVGGGLNTASPDPLHGWTARQHE